MIFFEIGFAFKKNTGDTRETASIYVAKHLLREHAKLSIYDPQVPDEQVKRDFDEYDALPDGYSFENRITLCKDAYTACKDAHAVLVLTEWDEFKDTELDYARIYKSMVKPAFVFDGRNILNLEKLKGIGFQIYGIGKPIEGHRDMSDEATVLM